MPRGPDHRKDDPGEAPLYRKFDLEDLERLIGWLRDAGATTDALTEEAHLQLGQPVVKLTPTELRDITDRVTSGFRWGEARIRRLLRVAVEIGWLREIQAGRTRSYALGPNAPQGETADVVAEKLAQKFAQEGDPVRAARIREDGATYIREQIREAVTGEPMRPWTE